MKKHNKSKSQKKINKNTYTKSKSKKNVSNNRRNKSNKSITKIKKNSNNKILRTKEEINMTFSPLLSKNSMKIVRKLNRSKSVKKKNYGKSQEEIDLIRKNEIRKKANPRINKKSKFLDKNSNLNELERFERLYRYSKIYSKKAKEQKQKKIEEELEKEIFLNSKKKKIKNSSIYNTIDISERNLVWQNRKNQKMEKIRQEKEKEEKKNCTFKPKILGKNYVKKDKGMAYTSEFVKEGLINHFNRIKMAKKKKSYKDLSK